VLPVYIEENEAHSGCTRMSRCGHRSRLRSSQQDARR
jgi:hypothetical protein